MIIIVIHSVIATKRPSVQQKAPQRVKPVKPKPTATKDRSPSVTSLSSQPSLPPPPQQQEPITPPSEQPVPELAPEEAPQQTSSAPSLDTEPTQPTQQKPISLDQKSVFRIISLLSLF